MRIIYEKADSTPTRLSVVFRVDLGVFSLLYAHKRQGVVYPIHPGRKSYCRPSQPVLAGCRSRDRSRCILCTTLPSPFLCSGAPSPPSLSTERFTKGNPCSLTAERIPCEKEYQFFANFSVTRGLKRSLWSLILRAISPSPKISLCPPKQGLKLGQKRRYMRGLSISPLTSFDASITMSSKYF